MYLHDGRVQLDGFDPDAHDLLPLQLFKDAVQCAILRPAVHAGIDGVPIAEALGQPTPLASLLGHIQNRVQHRQVRHADIATLTRQTGLDTTVLRLRDLHKHRITRKYQLVLTRPSSGLDSRLLSCRALSSFTTHQFIQAHSAWSMTRNAFGIDFGQNKASASPAKSFVCGGNRRYSMTVRRD